MTSSEYSGVGSIDSLGDIFDGFHAIKVFLVADKNSFASCGAETHIEKIKNVKFIQFNDFEYNPKIEDVSKGVKLFQQSNADAILAIGGGSVIDMAKLIRYYSLLNFENMPVEDILNYRNEDYKDQPRLIVIPTTAGTGSEATCFAVMYANKKKYSITGDSVLPDAVVLDPLVTMSIPAYITAVTGMDALCQAIESYWSNNSTDESKEYAKKAIPSILEFLPETVHNPNIQLRLNMLLAANLAGKAINISKTTAAHAVSYIFTSHFGIPHGLAVSLTLPDFLVYNYEVTEKDAEDSRGADYIKQTIGEIFNMLGGKTSLDSKNILEKFIENLGLSIDFSKHGIKSNDIDLILGNINNERLKNNPRRINVDELRKMIEQKIIG
jgi:alcohol dehydrogenase class IV